MSKVWPPIPATAGAVVVLLAGAVGAAPPTGDAAHGKRVYERCAACHSLERHRTGPKHCGLMGRRAGGAPGFDYSKAMVESKIVWNRETLDRFLKAPLTAVPGTSMGYAGVKDPKDRRDLIAFLETAADGSPACR